LRSFHQKLLPQKLSLKWKNTSTIKECGDQTERARVRKSAEDLLETQQ